MDSRDIVPTSEGQAAHEADRREPIEVLAEEFACALRAGKNPSITDYAARHPEQAARIKELFPFVAMMEKFQENPGGGDDVECELSVSPPSVATDAGPKQPTLGDYVLLSKIGSGGMGRVFKAKHRRMDRLVALKVLPPAVMKDSKAVQRFHREVKAAAKLFHPNVVAAYDAGEQDGVHYLVMEYVDGQVLSRIVKDHGPLSAEKAVDYALQIARGLEYAHSREVIHRDVKPGNLICAEDGTIKVVDFGLARFSSAGELTQSGTILGTVFYMSPEQITDPSGVDSRCDIYSLGCTLFYLLTGQPPFTGGIVDAIRAHQEEPPPLLRDLKEGIPPQLEVIVQKTLAKRPLDRHQSMGELIADLEAYDPNGPEASLPNRMRFHAGSRTMPAVGIDVGTTFSMIARIDSNGIPVTVRDADNELKMPSVVEINGLNINVGSNAFSGIGIPSDNVAIDIKRSLGQATFPRTLNDCQYPPEVLFALLLSQLANSGRRKIGEFSRVVLAVPNCFSELRRKSVMDAAYLAGLEAISLVNETIAAALYYHSQSRQQAEAKLERLLVIKLGASDFAVSVIHCDRDGVTTLSTETQPALGGQDFDDRMVEAIRKRISQEHGIQLAQDRGTSWLLRQKCETAKQTLSEKPAATIRLDSRGRSIPIQVTRDAFGEATRNLCDMIGDRVKVALKRAQIDWSDVDRVLLVGGATRMPIVQDLIARAAGPDKLIEALPEDAVVLGTALYAKLELERLEGKPPSTKVADVSAQDVGVRVSDRRTNKTANSTLIPRNSPLPVTYKSVFSAVSERQVSATLRIVQSSDAARLPFEPVGTCTIDGLNSEMGGRVSVELQISPSGRLSVHIESPATRLKVTKEIAYATGLSNVDLNQWREWVDTMMLCSGLF